MSKKRITKETMEKWLERIFSVQTLTVIVGAIAAFFAYKSYKDSQPAKIHFALITNLNDYIKVDNKTLFVNLIVPNNKLIPWGSGVLPDGTPVIVNESSKSIKNLKLEVDIFYPDCGICEISQDYDIVKHDSLVHLIKLGYKYDILNAFSSIQPPIENLYLDDSSSFPKDSCTMFWFHYNIIYDGASKPQGFTAIYYVYFDNNEFLRVTDEHVDEFLTNCYQEGYFTEVKDGTLVSIVDLARFYIVKPPKRLTDAKFEDFKKDFLSKR